MAPGLGGFLDLGLAIIRVRTLDAGGRVGGLFSSGTS